MLSDKDDFFASITDLYLLLNGKTLRGKKATYGSYFTTLRYALILLYAITSEIVREKEKDPKRDCTPFNIYRLNKIANLLHLEFDRTRVAKKVYAELMYKGFVKIEHKDGKEYICLTEKGKVNCRNKIEETRMLKKYFMTIPKLQERYIEQGQDQIGIVAKDSRQTDFHHEPRVVVYLLGSISDWDESVEGRGGDATYCRKCRTYSVIFDYLLALFVCSSCGSTADAAYCSECKRDGVIFDFGSSELVCKLCGWVANNKKAFEVLGFSTEFEFVVYEELQSIGINEAESKSITKSIYEKVKEEINIVGWKTKLNSWKRINVTICDILNENKFPEDKINELLPKITYWVSKDNYFNREDADRTPTSGGGKGRLRTQEKNNVPTGFYDTGSE